jgi:hypothetical protein
MSELVAELERRGYVERIPDPTDRRAVLVRRTARGWQVNAIARQVVEEAQREWAAQVGEREYMQALAVLRKIVAIIASPTVGVAGHPRTLASASSKSSPDSPGASSQGEQREQNKEPDEP